MDDDLRSLISALYEQIRHNHERAIALTNSTLALVAAMERTDPKFQKKYATAFAEQENSSRAEADGLALGVIDGILRALHEE